MGSNVQTETTTLIRNQFKHHGKRTKLLISKHGKILDGMRIDGIIKYQGTFIYVFVRIFHLCGQRKRFLP